MEGAFNINKFLKGAVSAGASDEHIKSGLPPFIRKNGVIRRISADSIKKEEIEAAIIEIAPSTMKETILSKTDMDFMYEIPGFSRFRINYSRQLGMPELVIRNIPYSVPSLENLELPGILGSIVDYQNGLILVTGPTGSGKSTTIASILSEIISTQHKHIITIEDPVEYVFVNKKSIVTQRQVGVDTESFADGIKYALRQDPDVIFIGEIRDRITLEAALKAAETGHLVFATLHTNDAVQTINRIVNMFDESSRELIRKQLADSLRATVAQKLVYSSKDDKRYPACEIMVVTSTIRDYIVKDQLDEIYGLINANTVDNMVSLNTSLAALVEKEKLTQEEAISYSNDNNELEKIFRGIYQGTKALYE